MSASPFSAHLIRAARRLAGGMQTDWLAVHIEPAKRRFPMGEKERDRVAHNIKLAEELGAKTLTVVGENLIDDMLEVARTHNVSTIVIGKPRHSFFREICHGSVVNKLIRRSDGINVHIIHGVEEPEYKPAIKAAPAKAGMPWRHYGGGLLMVFIITTFCWLLRNKIELVNVALLYQLPVIMSAFWWGRWPSYFAAVCGVVLFDLLFVSSATGLSLTDIRYLWSFITFLIVAFVIGGRTEFLRHEAASARQREKSARALYEFSREIAAVSDLGAITRGIARQAAETLDRPVVVILPEANGKLVVWAAYDPATQEQYWEIVNGDGDIVRQPLPDAAEAAVAFWAYEHGQTAGRSTETLPGASYLYIPLKTRDNIVGVFGIQVTNKLTPGERRLIDAWVGLAAIAVERARLAAQTREGGCGG
ncbi:MAG TPA: DUF4118 domain-containing protein [Methylomusa anaerophila]|uniref:DUF4118 domain-containing protein n=1 Tax=Methylomusa anaerophila TaxID=1930071 RepID=UPI0018D4F059|nr:DUF4118 domain-containing protein [Methylomusa anaerophila]HML89847.1 DUF4118 domain-containing protein [Methylomusa anaerophila]